MYEGVKVHQNHRQYNDNQPAFPVRLRHRRGADRFLPFLIVSGTGTRPLFLAHVAGSEGDRRLKANPHPGG